MVGRLSKFRALCYDCTGILRKSHKRWTVLSLKDSEAPCSCWAKDGGILCFACPEDMESGDKPTSEIFTKTSV